MKETVLRDFLFADEQEVQAKMDSFSVACNNFGRTISTKKTEVMFQPAAGNQYHEPQITVNGRGGRDLYLPRQHPLSHSHHRCRGQQQNLQGKQRIRKTE